VASASVSPFLGGELGRWGVGVDSREPPPSPFSVGDAELGGDVGS